MGVIAEGILMGCQGLFTPVSLGYPLSVFNKHSTLKETCVVYTVVGGLECGHGCVTCIRLSGSIDSRINYAPKCVCVFVRV